MSAPPTGSERSRSCSHPIQEPTGPAPSSRTPTDDDTQFALFVSRPGSSAPTLHRPRIEQPPPTRGDAAMRSATARTRSSSSRCARLPGWPSASVFGPAEAAMPAVRVPMTARNEAPAVTAARVSLRRFLVVRANVNRFRSLASPSGVRNSALGHQGGRFDAEPDQRAI